ncbi:UBTD2 [Symbiodinium sp. KB8]|nr:UBTD2 [Symbiodinium sp. KB8]
MGCFASTAAGEEGAAAAPRAGGRGRVGATPDPERPGRTGGPYLATAGPVRAPEPWDFERPITLEELDRLRVEYWESLLTGSNQSRETIRVAADCAMTGDYDSATAILQAVDFRTAGTLAVVWDSRGNQYNLPTYVYSRPRNVLSAEEAAAMHRQVQAHVGPVVDVPVVVRLSSSKTTLEQDIPLTLRSDNTISEVKGVLHEELLTGSHDKKEGSDNTWAGVGLPPARQRVIYNGREMVDGHHLQQCGVAPGSFLQVFIRMPLHPAAGGQGAAS